MWLLQDEASPSHMTIDNFMNETLLWKIEDIFTEINSYIFQKENVDTEHVYIDGTKIAANAAKKSCIKNRDKTFLKITALLNEINERTAAFGVKFETRTEYAVEYAEQITEQYKRQFNIDSKVIVKGRGHRKTTEQHHYE